MVCLNQLVNPKLMEKFFTAVFNFKEFIFVYVVNIRFTCDGEIYLLNNNRSPSSLKILYESSPADNVNKLDNSNMLIHEAIKTSWLIMLWEDSIAFLKEQINRKDRA